MAEKEQRRPKVFLLNLDLALSLQIRDLRHSHKLASSGPYELTILIRA